MLSFCRKYLDKLPYAVFICNKNAKVLYYNQAFKKIFEPHSKKTTLGRAINCQQNQAECGKGLQCLICPLRKTLNKFKNEKTPAFTQRILKDVTINGENKSLYFTMTLKRVGSRFLAIIENSLEMNLYGELIAARTLQQKMLPPLDLNCGKKFSYLYRPSGEIGGDLLDVYNASNLTCGFVADVSGRGIGAAMLSSFIKTAYDQKKPLLASALHNVNSKYRGLKTNELEYITMLAVAIDAQSNLIYYTAAGHTVPLIMKKDGKVIELEVSSPPISNWFDDYNYVNFTESFSSGDIALLITDGIVEAKNQKGERYGLKRVKNILLQSTTAKDFTKKIEEDLASFSNYANDDMTALAFDL